MTTSISIVKSRKTMRPYQK